MTAITTATITAETTTATENFSNYNKKKGGLGAALFIWG